jgi:hypothetical protein
MSVNRRGILATAHVPKVLQMVARVNIIPALPVQNDIMMCHMLENLLRHHLPLLWN